MVLFDDFDPTIVRVTANDIVGREAVVLKLTTLLAEANISNTASVTEYEIRPKFPLKSVQSSPRNRSKVPFDIGPKFPYKSVQSSPGNRSGVPLEVGLEFP